MVNLSYLPCIKCVCLIDILNKTITCYTFSVKPTILESKNVKAVMKKIDEEENEDFCEEGYFNFGVPYFRRRKNILKIFCAR